MKVVYNQSYGGFYINDQLKQDYKDKTGITLKSNFNPEIPRHDPVLVELVEKLIEGGALTDLRITEVSGPYWIQEYDGSETVWEPHTIPWVTDIPGWEVRFIVPDTRAASHA